MSMILAATAALLMLAAPVAASTDIPTGAAKEAPASAAAPVRALKVGSLRSAPRGNYVGSKECRECHSKPIKDFLQTTMGKLFTFDPKNELQERNCEACHGPGEQHIANPRVKGSILTFGKGSPFSAKAQNAMCEQCHNKGVHRYWKGSPHEERGLMCVSCHTVMSEVSDKFQLTRTTVLDTCSQCHDTKAAQFLRSSHMPLHEGKMTCTDCHNPHGATTDKMLKAASVNQLCFKCHAEKRGPYLWEHPPVAENCLNCHVPHGSMNEYLLKMKRPRLCQQCHSNDHANTARTVTDRFAFNRSCQQCHIMIHGSNHPSGQQLNR